jgi:hypothetical protein
MRTTLRILAPLGLLLATACASTVESNPTVDSSGTTTVTTITSTVPATSVPRTSAPDTSAPGTLPGDDVAMAVYFVRDGKLVVEGRDLAQWDGELVMDALLAGPTDVERAGAVTTAIPTGTVLHSVVVSGSEAVVDLGAEFESGGGSMSMMLRVAQVVYTLTTLPDVDTVRFSIDGTPRDTIGGEGLMVNGVNRTTFADHVLPGILLEQPFDRSVLANPIVIGGMTNAFEATVNYQVLDTNGTVIAEGVTTATCGTGCWGGFTASISLPTGATVPVTLRVFDYSEADGTTMLDVVAIMLT